jgi:hypothetical protein
MDDGAVDGDGDSCKWRSGVQLTHRVGAETLKRDLA